MKSDPNLTEQYKTDENLRIRIDTHRLYTIGPPLEPAIDQALNLAGDESLLDIGTGPGDFPARLRAVGHRGQLVGIDASPGMIAKAASANSGLQFLVADAQSLPFADGAFDIVTARHMLYHVPDIPRALRDAHRVLRPGGRFLAVTNAHDNMREFYVACSQAADALRGKISRETRIATTIPPVFTEQNAPALLREVFANVKLVRVEAFLRFETPHPAIRYFDSCRTLRGLTPEEWDAARDAFAAVLPQRFAGGPWLISKTIILLIAEKPSHTSNSI
jgi:SAM-dependent methyltransferase